MGKLSTVFLRVVFACSSKTQYFLGDDDACGKNHKNKWNPSFTSCECRDSNFGAQIKQIAKRRSRKSRVDQTSSKNENETFFPCSRKSGTEKKFLLLKFIFSEFFFKTQYFFFFFISIFKNFFRHESPRNFWTPPWKSRTHESLFGYLVDDEGVERVFVRNNGKGGESYIEMETKPLDSLRRSPINEGEARATLQFFENLPANEDLSQTLVCVYPGVFHIDSTILPRAKEIELVKMKIENSP